MPTLKLRVRPVHADMNTEARACDRANKQGSSPCHFLNGCNTLLARVVCIAHAHDELFEVGGRAHDLKKLKHVAVVAQSYSFQFKRG
jgi:hypothetical protein